MSRRHRTPRPCGQLATARPTLPAASHGQQVVWATLVDVTSWEPAMWADCGILPASFHHAAARLMSRGAVRTTTPRGCGREVPGRRGGGRGGDKQRGCHVVDLAVRQTWKF